MRRERVLLLPLLLLVAILIVELGYRVVVGEETEAAIRDLQEFVEHGHDTFQPWPYTGYVTRGRGKRTKDLTRPIDWRFDAPTGEDVIRVACLGASTTRGRYPFELSRLLEEETERSFFVMNWGVDGWTTQETMVNYFTNVQDYEPDVVVIHHALSDVEARRWQGYRSDYAHLRRPWTEVELGSVERWLMENSYLYGRIQLNHRETRFALQEYIRTEWTPECLPVDAPAAELPEDTAYAFRRNLSTIIRHARSRGALVVLMTQPYKPGAALPAADGSQRLWVAALEEHNRIARELAAENDCLLVDAEAWAKADPTAVDPLFLDRVHLTIPGNQEKARLLYEALAGYDWDA